MAKCCFLSGISGVNDLGRLSPAAADMIEHNKAVISQALNQAQAFNGLGKLVPGEKDYIDMETVIRQYNRGISDDEIKAWVYYKQSIGIPMTGWEKWFIRSGTQSLDQVITITKATIKDNHFRDIKEVEAGKTLGKYIKTHVYSTELSYYIFRNEEGLFYVVSSSCKIEKTKSTFDTGELNKLVQSGALYYNDGELLPYPVFVYGNMYFIEKKLADSKDYIIKTWGQEVYDRHEKAVKERKPAILTVTNPDPNERPQISAISDFAKDTDIFYITLVRDEYMDIDNAQELKKTNGKIETKRQKEKIDVTFDGERKYNLQHIFIKWLFSLNRDTDFDKSDPVDIADYYISGKVLKDENMSAEEKSELKANARIEGEKMFSRFLNEVLTFEDQQKLDYLWNSLYNAQSDIAFERVPVGFTISRYFKSGVLQLTPIQREGVAFMEMMGSGINAFDVGVGKTMTAIVTVANFMASGKCKRPLIVVPKPTYEKWKREITGYDDRKTGKFVPGVLSYTDVTLNDWGNLGTGGVGINVNKLNLKTKVKEKTITVITHEGLTKIGYSEKAMNEIFDSLVNILTQDKFKKSDRDKEKEYQKLREMMGVGLKDTICDIDALGFDFVIIDEAHNFKNVFSEVASEEEESGRKRKQYNISGNVSARAQKAFLLLNYIQRKFGRNTMLLTATPFTNSPLEIYSMLSLVAYESLKRNGIVNIKTFFDLFVLPTLEWAANYKEEIVEKEVIKSFRNRLLLQTIIYNHIHYKTGEEAGVKRPCKINLPLIYDYAGKGQRLPMSRQILTYINMSPKQRELQNRIVAMAKNATSGKLDMGAIFKALNYSLDNALSPFIITKEQPADYKDFIESSPKLKYVMDCIASVKQWHDDRGEKISGQVIYMNRGKEYFHYIKEYLQKEVGFKTHISYDRSTIDEVELLTSEISEGRKENVKEAFLDGVCKIIIGTATIREGIDLQRNGTVIYNCYPEWNPTDIRQLEGRVWRQGNRFGYVRVVMPLVQDSMDVFVFQKLEEKTSRINDIWYRADRGNVLDLESLDPQEIKLTLITDTSRLVKMFFDQELEELNRKFKRAKNNISTIEGIYYDIRQYFEYKEKVKEEIDYYYQRLLDSVYFNDDYLNNETADERAYFKDHKKLYEKAKSLKENIEALRESKYADDKEILSVGRQIERAYSDLHISSISSYKFSYFKEYVSTVRKAEKTILTPRGYTIESDLAPLLSELKKELIGVFREWLLFNDTNEPSVQSLMEKTDEALLLDMQYVKDMTATKGHDKSQRWQSLTAEIQTKKSALNVEGKTAAERAIEFSNLNYLLAYRMDDITPGSCAIPSEDYDPAPAIKKLIEPQTGIDELQIEMELLELELQLLNFDELQGYPTKPEIIILGNVELNRVNIPEVDVIYKPGITYGKITDSKDIAELGRKIMGGQINTRELFITFYLNNANIITGYYMVSKGGTKSTVADLKLIFNYALKSLSQGIIIMHNHPSGNPQPSNADKVITENMNNVAKMHEILLLDHVIITQNDYYSFADSGGRLQGLPAGGINNVNNLDDDFLEIEKELRKV